MATVEVTNEFWWNAHTTLLDGAHHFLEKAREKRPGCFYDWLGAILLSALAFEAIANGFGKALIPDWSEKVRGDKSKGDGGAGTLRKMELVAEQCKTSVGEWKSDPWKTAKSLKVLRDEICHASRTTLVEKFSDRDETNYGAVFGKRLPAWLEHEVTEEFAVRACKAVREVVSKLLEALPDAQRHRLGCNSGFFSARVMPDHSK